MSSCEFGEDRRTSSEERDRLLERNQHALRPCGKTVCVMRVAFPKWPGSFRELCLFDPALCHHPGNQLRSSPGDRGTATVKQLQLQERYWYHSIKFLKFESMIFSAGTNHAPYLRWHHVKVIRCDRFIYLYTYIVT